MANFRKIIFDNNSLTYFDSQYGEFKFIEDNLVSNGMKALY